MSDLFNTASALGKLGLLGFVIFVLVFGAAAVGREWIVPGRTHRREIERGDKLEVTNEKLADSLDRITEIIEKRGHGR